MASTAARVFITGLSAGGAMTSAMLAAYPEVFAAGAIIAGLPYGTAGNVQQAFESMFQGRSHTAKEWGDLVRRASTHRGPWPRVSIWHGDLDATVKPVNADSLVQQWTDVHGIDRGAGRRQGRRLSAQGLAPRRRRCRSSPTPSPAWRMARRSRPAGARTATAGPFLLEVGISSS